MHILPQDSPASEAPAERRAAPEIAAGVAKLDGINRIATVLGTLLFMVFKPTP